MDKVNKTPMAINDERLKQLQALFPEAFAEGKVDFDKLRQALGENVDSRPERYSFTWAGKREAMQAAQIPSRAALIPDFEESVNFDETQNVFIEGDNLEVLKLLVHPYFGRVKMIYIDPPYNTGNDFVYPDNYTDPLDTYLRVTGQKNGNGDLLTTNAESNGRYHSAWLSMMYPRLQIARQLLHDDGILFISIDYHEIYHLRMVLNELFGEENFVGELIWKRRQNVDSRTKTGLSLDHEYAVIYRKNGEGRIRGAEKDLTKYSNPDNDPRGPWASDNLVGLSLKISLAGINSKKIPESVFNKSPSSSLVS
jgi:adenine-specific DNA-methyltransferase